MESPAIPTQFPCWVKAVYSWGGETKHDLGFMEGDYIECLNAGDGSWWTGRLKRDRRMVGQFPSNFVKVLDQDSIPSTRNASPLPTCSGLNSPGLSSPPKATPPRPAAQKTRSWRKPFTAYHAAGAPNPQAAARESESRQSSQEKPKPQTPKSFKPRPYSSMKKPELNTTPPKPSPLRSPPPTIPQPIPRASSRMADAESVDYFGPSSAQAKVEQQLSREPSPAPPQVQKPYSRAPSPAPPRVSQHHSRAPSPAPPQAQHQYSRAPSPSPPQVQHGYSRAPSPAPQDDLESSPPPPPPPAHRVAYTRPVSPASLHGESPQPYSHHHDRAPDRTPSPKPSHGGGMTPSPLRDAMNDVMSSLDGMKMEHRTSPTKPQDFPDTDNIWSPNDLNEFYAQPAREQRAHTSAGFTSDNRFDGEADDDASFDDRPDPLREYVRKMEARLGQNREESDYSTAQSSQAPVANNHSLPDVPDSSYSGARPVSSSGYNLSAAESFAPIANREDDSLGRLPSQRTLNHRKSAFELGRERMARTFTTKSSSTNASSTAHSSSTHNSNSTSSTGRSLMSGHSAGGFSATSAGSLAKRQLQRAGSFKRPKSSMSSYPSAEAASGVSYHSSHETDAHASVEGSQELVHASEQGGLLGGLAAPITKKRGFFKKLMDQVQTSTASARTNMNEKNDQRPRRKSLIGNGITSISGGVQPKKNLRDMGPGAGSGDWVQMRRDVNRSNSLSHNERSERVERCQMMDVPVMSPVDVLNETAEGDESVDGYPVSDPTDFQACKLALVDKSARFVANLPAIVNPISLAKSYLCRPYKSDVQRLRAIFTWVSERVSWEEDFEGEIDARRVIQTRRGCSEEIAVLVREMCIAVGYQAEVVRGYLKSPGEVFLTRDLNEAAARPNHWWNAVVADGEWRIMDCSLANPTNPKRGSYSALGSQAAESWWFLARPLEICYTHVPLLPEQQHIIPPMPHDVLMALPVACPPFFKYNLGMWDFDTSLLHLEGLEMAHVQLAVPDDVECIAEVECRAFAKDSDGDYFENGDVERKRALAQAEFVSVPGEAGAVPPFKRYTIKAVLPSRDNTAPSGVLKVYAGRRGLMHSINSNPHSLALGLALNHDGGENPPYDFFVRHPTPHALRHEIYVVGPLCRKLSINNTFVFCVRQHPATPNSAAETGAAGGAQTRPGSPNPNGRPGSTLSIQRPGSALSMASISASGSAYSNPTGATSGSDASGSGAGKDAAGVQKPAKLAIQSPSGKILRMSRKADTHASGATAAVMGNGRGRGGAGAGSEGEVKKTGTSWETIIKIGERGVWRGLVLADRSARWCVFGEWEAV